MEKSYAALEWALPLNRISKRQMRPYLRVACELLLGAINGSAHIARANFQIIKHQGKRKEYIERLNVIHEEAIQKYQNVISILTS